MGDSYGRKWDVKPMNNNKHSVEQYEIKKISIRGRMGYAIACFEKAIFFFEAQTPQISKLISFLWSYTLSIQLDLWDEQFKQMVPENINEFIEQFGLRFLDDKTCVFIFDILEDIYEVATGNLYGGYASSYTETPLLRIIEKLNDKNIILPAIAPYAISSVNEENGWGRPIVKSAFENKGTVLD